MLCYNITFRMSCAMAQKTWQYRVFLLCVLVFLVGQQVAGAHASAHLDGHEAGDCHDCDALKLFKAGLISGSCNPPARFEAVTVAARPPQSPRRPAITLSSIRAPPAASP